MTEFESSVADFREIWANPLRRMGGLHRQSSQTGKPRDRNLVADNVAERIREVASSGIGWPIVMLGASGGGKTCAALCALDHFGGVYFELSDFTDRITKARRGELWWDDSQGYRIPESEVWDLWDKSNLAVLDEIAMRSPTDAQFDTLKRMLDRRDGRPLIVISNFSMEQIVRVYDDRIASRLSQGTVIKFADDRRTTG